MRTRTFGSLAALGGLMICAATAAAADNKGFYVGANIGQSHYPDHAHLNLGNIPLDGEGLDNEDLAWSITAGYRFSRYFALEAGYLDLGGVSGTLTDTSGATNTVANVRFEARGPTLAALGILPIGKWSPFIKTGVIFHDVDLTLDGQINSSPFSLHGETKDGVTILWGTGTGYEINDRWSANLELGYFDDLGDDENTGRASIFTLTFGITYRF